MTPSYRRNRQGLQSRFWIWTIHRQSFLSRHIIMYLWAGVTAILFLSFIGRFSMEVALYSIFFGGMILLFVLCVLIERRKTWLLNVKDPVVRSKAYHAMLSYMITKGLLEADDSNSFQSGASG